jgi:hypothetical protein
MTLALEQCNLVPLTEYAKRVWETSAIAAKKSIILEAIENFKFKGKTERFRRLVEAETKATRLDKLITDLVLIEDGNKVIR